MKSNSNQINNSKPKNYFFIKNEIGKTNRKSTSKNNPFIDAIKCSFNLD